MEAKKNIIVESNVSEWIAALLVFALFVCLTPILVPVYLIIFLYRTIVAFEIRRRYSHLGPKDYPCGQLLKPMDVWSYFGNNQGINVLNCAFLLDDLPEKERIRNDVLNLIVNKTGPDGKIRFPRFRMFPQNFLGLLFWNYASRFDIDNHLRYYEDKEIVVGRTNIQRALEKVANDPLPGNGKPCWEIVIVKFQAEKSNPKLNCACVIRFNHCYSNGVSIFRVLTDSVLTSVEEQDQTERKQILEAVTKQPNMQDDKRFPWKKIMFVVKAALFMPYHVVYLAMTGDRKHALHSRKMANHSRIAWSDQFPLENLKPIRAETRCSINDIFVSCLLGALRRYYKTNKLELPSKINIVCPVSIENMSEIPQLRNSNSFIYMRMMMDIEDPLARLRAVNRIMTKKKESQDYLMNLWMASFTNILPFWLLRKLVECGDATMVASNIPGPIKPLRLFGSKVDVLFGIFTTVAKTGMGVAMFSWGGNIQLSITMDEGLEPDRQRLDGIAQFFVEEVNNLHSIVTRKQK